MKPPRRMGSPISAHNDFWLRLRFLHHPVGYQIKFIKKLKLKKKTKLTKPEDERHSIQLFSSRFVTSTSRPSEAMVTSKRCRYGASDFIGRHDDQALVPFFGSSAEGFRTHKNHLGGGGGSMFFIFTFSWGSGFILFFFFFSFEIFTFNLGK